MLRTLALAALIAIVAAFPAALYSQCLVPPPLEDCDGTEPSLADNETLLTGDKKWFYGTSAVYNSITLRGGTLIVCGNLTFTNFNMESGTIVIRPGAELHIGGGAGVILRGNCNIYNYGLFECTSNLSLDPPSVLPSAPNVVINATPTSFFKMSNQYFTINNANSFFVNRGKAEFWGLITDYGAGPGSVCLGRFSEMNMAYLFNNRKHTYIAPEGAACVRVFQGSQNRDTLTASMNINICLGNSHSVLACGGCPVVGWGTTNVFAFCNACAEITLLDMELTGFAVSKRAAGWKLSWQTNKPGTGYLFYAERATDGTHFSAFDSFSGDTYAGSGYAVVDSDPPAGTVYYRIRAVHPGSKSEHLTRAIKVTNGVAGDVLISPNPFVRDIRIQWFDHKQPQAVVISSITGAVIFQQKIASGHPGGVTISLPLLPPGKYAVKLVYKDAVVIRQLVKI